MLPIISALIFLATSTPTFAQDAAAEGAKTPTIKVPVDHMKSGLTTDLYEDEPEESQEKGAKLLSLTAKVKVVREESDGVEVFFEGEKNTGSFFLHRAIPHYAKALKTLEESKKPQGAPISVSYTEDKKIKSVEKKANTIKEPPTNPNEKWDFSVPPGK